MNSDIYAFVIQLADIIRFIGAIVLILALMFGVEMSARAHPGLTNQLDSRFSETSIAIGLASNNVVVGVFSNGDGSTWTVVFTKPDGMSCVMATGEDWET